MVFFGSVRWAMRLWYAAALLFWLGVYDSLIDVLFLCTCSLLSCCWTAFCAWFFQLLGGFLVLFFPSLRGVAGCFSVFSCAVIALLFVSLFQPRVFVCLAHSRRE
jgi:hypothetical protein